MQVALRSYCPVRRGWVTVSQLDLPSLTPLSVTGSGRPQLGAVHLPTSVAVRQVVYN